jgi:hypothetical protein
MAAVRSRKGTRASRIVAKHFGDIQRFDPKGGNFSPLPWIYRRLLWFFPPRAWQVFTYLVMRSGPEGLSWLNDKQIATDLGIGHRKIGPQLSWLKEHGFIATLEVEGLRYVCLVDPLVPLAALFHKGGLPHARVETLSEDLELLGFVSFDDLPIASHATAENAQ